MTAEETLIFLERNLAKTIDSKRRLMQLLEAQLENAPPGEGAPHAIEFLRINLEELEGILADVQRGLENNGTKQ